MKITFCRSALNLALQELILSLIYCVFVVCFLAKHTHSFLLSTIVVTIDVIIFALMGCINSLDIISLAFNHHHKQGGGVNYYLKKW